MSDEITEQQAQEMLREFAESRATHQTFFKDVVKAEDTTKVGNLNTEELGEAQLELRGVKELELICKDICNEKELSDYFKHLGEIQTSTSLSKEGFLMRLFVTSKKEMADVTVQEKKKNTGWFKKS